MTRFFIYLNFNYFTESLLSQLEEQLVGVTEDEIVMIDMIDVVVAVATIGKLIYKKKL